MLHKISTTFRKKQAILPLITNHNFHSQRVSPNKARIPPLITFQSNSPNHYQQLQQEQNEQSNQYATTLSSTINLNEWDEKNLPSEDNFWQNKILEKSKTLRRQSAIYQVNKEKSITNHFINIKTKQSSSEIKQLVKGIQTNNTTALKNIDPDKKRFNFNVFQSPKEKKIAYFDTINNGAFSLETHQTPKRISYGKAHNHLTVSFADKRNHSTDITKTNNNYEKGLFDLQGTLENLVNSKVVHHQINKYKIEQHFNDELRKTGISIQKKEKDQQNIMDHLKLIIQTLDEKQESYSNSKDAIDIIFKDIQSQKKHSTNKDKVSFEENSILYDKIASAKNELESLKQDYEKQQSHNRQVVPLLQYKLKEVKADIKSLKRLHHSMIQESIHYYKSLLKAGIDVRGVGLGWLICKLIELGYAVKFEDLPLFITEQFFQYLMIFSMRRIEIIKLNTLIALIKKRYIKKQAYVKKERFDNELSIGNLFESGKDIKKCWDMILRNNLGLANEHNKLNDDIEIKKILNRIKNEDKEKEIIEDKEKNHIHMRNRSCEMNNTFLITQQKVFDHLEGNNSDEKKNILEALLYLNNLIAIKEGELHEIKKAQILFFKTKYNSSKTKATEECFNYDLIYFALFGNYTYM